jgi:hypothetical protein
MPDEKTPLFVLQQPDTFKWPVRVPVPMNGQYGFAEFTATFPNLDEIGIQKLLKTDERGGPTRTDADVAPEVLLSFEGVKTPEGGEVPFSEENKAALLRAPRVCNAVVGTFLAAARGLAAEKNS